VTRDHHSADDSRRGATRTPPVESSGRAHSVPRLAFGAAPCGPPRCAFGAFQKLDGASKCPVRGPLCANRQIHKCGLARLDLNIARIERAEVLLRQHRASVFRRLEIEVDEFVHGAAVQETQHFAQDKRCGRGSGAAAIGSAGAPRGRVGRRVRDGLTARREAPDARRGEAP